MGSARSIGNAITDGGAAAGDDATGGKVGCLTEAVMGMTAALARIADALENVASAIAEGKGNG